MQRTRRRGVHGRRRSKRLAARQARERARAHRRLQSALLDRFGHGGFASYCPPVMRRNGRLLTIQNR